MFDIAWCDKYDLSALRLAAPSFIKKENFVTFYITFRMYDDI